MPKVGLSRPYVAVYVNSNGIVSYRDGIRMGRAVEYSLEVETSEGNDFYADNTIGETVNGIFTGGTLTMTTAELEQAVTKLILGIKTGTVTVNGQEITELIYDEEAVSPNLGFGVIIKNIIRGITSWTAVVLKKLAFNVPGEDVTTQGEEIEWQTQETTATVMRDDSATAQWQVRAESLATEAMADAYIRFKLNMPLDNIGSLTVSTAEGTQAGYTAVTVLETPDSGNHLVYRLGANLQVPYYDQSTGAEEGYTTWNGTDEIDAGGAQQILVVEVTADENARKAGVAAVEAAQ